MMRRKMIVWISICLLGAFLLAGCSGQQIAALTPTQTRETATPPQPKTQAETSFYGKLSVEGTQLVGKGGTSVQLQGISSHGLSWFPEFVNAETLGQAKDEWGCNVFRLALYTAEHNGYCTGDEANRRELENLIDSAVKDAEALGLYIIIDWHTLSDHNPLLYRDEALIFFASMAEKYKDKEHVLYEICNEPNGDTTWEDIKTYAQQVIPTIRAHTDAVILVGTPNWSQRVDLAAQSPLEGVENVLYTLHFYAATHKDDLRQSMQQAIDAGLPVFVSEFGICDASGDGAIGEEQAGLWLEMMDKNKVSYVMWNLSNKDESAAMIKSDVSKTSGFTQDDLSPAGRWFVNRYNQAAPLAGQQTESPAIEGSGQIDISLEESWKEGDDTAYKYIITIRNPNNEAIQGWAADITFNQAFRLSDSWNGDFSLDGQALTVTPKDYNNELKPNVPIVLGCIVKGDGGLSVLSSGLR